MNSFKAVFKALQYEEKRQRQVVYQGGKLVQETRGWLEDKGVTISQRSKEYAHDYRYMPEPDLPPLNFSASWITEIEKELPELPAARKERFIKDYSLSAYDAGFLTTTKEMADYFEQVIAVGQEIKPKEVTNWLSGTISGIINANNVDIAAFAAKVSPAKLAELLIKTVRGEVSTAVAKTVLEEMFATGKDAAVVIANRGLSQISDSDEIAVVARRIMADNPKAVADFKIGKEQAMKFMVGQMMRATKGRINPQQATQTIKQMLQEG